MMLIWSSHSLSATVKVVSHSAYVARAMATFITIFPFPSIKYQYRILLESFLIWGFVKNKSSSILANCLKKFDGKVCLWGGLKIHEKKTIFHRLLRDCVTHFPFPRIPNNTKYCHSSSKSDLCIDHVPIYTRGASNCWTDYWFHGAVEENARELPPLITSGSIRISRVFLSRNVDEFQPDPTDCFRFGLTIFLEETN